MILGFLGNIASLKSAERKIIANFEGNVRQHKLFSQSEIFCQTLGGKYLIFRLIKIMTPFRNPFHILIKITAYKKFILKFHE